MLETYVLHITKECNCACLYCYEKDKTSIYTWEQIREVIDNIIKHNPEFNLEFLGGEPCLRIDLIRKVVEYIESKSDECKCHHYTITTNGTIINSDLINLMLQYPTISWAASMDGTPFMNSLRILKDGRNTHDVVIKNFKELSDHIYNHRLSVHMVTHPYNIGYYVDGVKHLYNQGFRKFGIGTIESTIIIDQEYCNEFIRQHKILSDMLHAGELPGIDIGLFSGLKPKSDARYYVRDDTGKVLLETYGRAKNDIKDSDEFKTSPSGSPLGDMIYNIREAVYNYHNNIK